MCRCTRRRTGNCFPTRNRARTVLDALLAEASRAGVEVRVEQRVVSVQRDRDGDGFVVETAGRDRYLARAVVLATGGRSLPKTGSDGLGYGLARALGHGYVETTPALAPLLLNGTMHAGLSGVAHPAALTVRGSGAGVPSDVRLEGSMLWTHFGISGPVALNASRHWHRARMQGQAVDVLLNVCPGETFETLEAWFLAQERSRPKAMVSTALSARLPAAVADAWMAQAGIAADVTLAHLPRDDRRRLVRALLETRLDVRDSRGYNFAEVTCWRHPARGDRSGAHGVARLPAPVPRGRDPRRRRTSRRLQFSVGVVVRVGGGAGAWASAFSSAAALTRKWDADHTTRPSRTSSACGVSCRTPSLAAMAFETSRCVCTVTRA